MSWLKLFAIVLLLHLFPAAAGVLEYEEKYPNIVRPTVTVGGYPDQGSILRDPISAAYSDDGLLYVVEAGNHRVSVLGPSGERIRIIGGYGSAQNQFTAPTAAAVDGNEVFVVDSGASRISVFTPDGHWLRNWGRYGSGKGHFKDPRGVAAHGDRIAVADTGNNRIQVFDRKGKLLLVIADPGFNEPSGVAISGNVLWVADTHANRIASYDLRTGKGRKAVGVYGSYPGQFAEPVSISAAGRELFVTDLVNHRIQIFSDSGDFKYTFARHPTYPREGNGRVHYPLGIAVSKDGQRVAICESFENRVQVFDAEAVKKNYVAVTDSAWWDKYPQFHYGRRLKIALGKDMQIPWPGDVMTMSEPDTHKVIVFDVSGDAPFKLAEFGEFGERIGQLKGPHGVGVNVYGEMFITDSFNHRVVVLDLSRMTESSEMQRLAAELRTHYVTTAAEMNRVLKPLTPPVLRVWGRRGDGPGEFNTPSSGSAVTTMAALRDLAFVGDTRNHRIQVFRRDGTFTGKIVGGYGSGPGQLNLPTDLVVDNKHGILYVVEAFNRRVSAFDAVTLKFKYHLGSPGVEEGQFMAPSGAAVDSDGNVFVTDQGTHKISKFSPVIEMGSVTGAKYAGRWGQYGVEPGAMLYPQGITIDSKNRVYIVDFGNHRGQVFDRDGRFLRVFGEQMLSPKGDQFPVAQAPAAGVMGQPGGPAPLSAPMATDVSPPKDDRRVATNAKGYFVGVGSVSRLKTGELLSLEVNITTADGASANAELVEFDARMEAHNHGMNVRPRITSLGPGKFRIDGVLLHMQGDWTFYFDVKGPTVTERAQFTALVGG